MLQVRGAKLTCNTHMQRCLILCENQVIDIDPVNGQRAVVYQKACVIWVSPAASLT